MRYSESAADPERDLIAREDWLPHTFRRLGVLIVGGQAITKDRADQYSRQTERNSGERT
jgi:hypothetical protein